MNIYKFCSYNDIDAPFIIGSVLTGLVIVGASAIISYNLITSEPLFHKGLDVSNSRISQEVKVAPKCLNLVESLSGELLYAQKRLTLIDLQKCTDKTLFSSLYNSEFQRFENSLLSIEKDPYSVDSEKLNKEIEDLLTNLSHPIFGLSGIRYYKLSFIAIFFGKFLFYTAFGFFIAVCVYFLILGIRIRSIS